MTDYNDTPLRLLVIGYFDRGNYGDDLMRAGLEACLHAKLPNAALNFAQLPRVTLHSFRDLSFLLRAASASDRVIFCGGTHLHDEHLGRSGRLLAAHLVIALTLRMIGRPLNFAAVGIGPLAHHWSRSLARWILGSGELLILRDRRSMDLAAELNARVETTRGGDLALLVPITSQARRRSDVIGISLVPYFQRRAGRTDLDNIMSRSLASAINLAARECGIGTARVFIASRSQSSNDTTIATEFANNIDSSVAVELVPYHDPIEFLDALAECCAVVSARYHCTLMASRLGLPVVCIAYEDKCVGLAEELMLDPRAVAWPEQLLDPDICARLIKQILKDESDDSGRGVAEYRKRAQDGAEVLLAQLRQTSRDGKAEQ
jgi:polysaccharide pyruvyl transferase WcaK-like protein